MKLNKTIAALIGVLSLIGCASFDEAGAIKTFASDSSSLTPTDSCAHLQNDPNRKFDCLSHSEAQSIEEKVEKFTEMTAIAAEHRPADFLEVSFDLAIYTELLAPEQISQKTAEFAAIGTIVNTLSTGTSVIPTQITEIVREYCAPLTFSDITDLTPIKLYQIRLAFKNNMKEACYYYLTGDTERARCMLAGASIAAERIPDLKHLWLDTGTMTSANGGYRYLQYQLRSAR